MKKDPIIHYKRRPYISPEGMKLFLHYGKCNSQGYVGSVTEHLLDMYGALGLCPSTSKKIRKRKEQEKKKKRARKKKKKRKRQKGQPRILDLSGTTKYLLLITLITWSNWPTVVYQFVKMRALSG